MVAQCRPDGAFKLRARQRGVRIRPARRARREPSLRHPRPMNQVARNDNTRRPSRFRAKIEHISAWDRSASVLFPRTIQNDQIEVPVQLQAIFGPGILSRGVVATRGTAAHAACSAGCPVCGSAGGSGPTYAERSAAFCKLDDHLLRDIGLNRLVLSYWFAASSQRVAASQPLEMGVRGGVIAVAPFPQRN